MGFNYSKLRGRIKEVYGTQGKFAEAMTLSQVSVSDKLNNKVQWTQKEIDHACLLLGINPVDISAYFFTI